MADHYRTLVQSLMTLGFLFRRQGEDRQEVWRNRSTGLEVAFDRATVSESRAAVETVLDAAQARKPPDGAAKTTAEIAPASAAKRNRPSSERPPKSAPKPAPKAAGKRKPAAKSAGKSAAKRKSRAPAKARIAAKAKTRRTIGRAGRS